MKKDFNWFTFFAVYHSLTRKLRRLLHLNCQQKKKNIIQHQGNVDSEIICIEGGNVQSGKYPLGEMSGQGNIQSEKCPVGEIAARGYVWLGKCQFGEVSVGELSSRGCVSRGGDEPKGRLSWLIKFTKRCFTKFMKELIQHYMQLLDSVGYEQVISLMERHYHNPRTIVVACRRGIKK